MMSKSVRRQAGVLLLLLFCLPLLLRAQLSKQDEETAKGMIAGTLYLRLDVPLKSVLGGFGYGPEALLEVSPAGHDAARKLGMPIDSKKEKLNWAFYPNYPVHSGKLSLKGDAVTVSTEGVKPNQYEIMIDFIHINTLDDFTKAFNQTFSKVPLQDEHPEWPADVRSAIAEHKLVVGMTKEQAFDVVGTPLDIKTDVVNGSRVEIWHPRQEKGRMLSRAHRGDGENLGSTGFPVQLKFVDGKLQSIG
jgi:hypothetical protein